MSHPAAPAAFPPTAGDRRRWLLDAVGTYLVGDGRGPTGRDEAARRALRNGDAGFRRFLDHQCAPTEVVCTVVAIDRDGQCVHRGAFRCVPGPIDLLRIATHWCRDGDTVTVRQTTADRGVVTATERWPFGMDSALQLTLPAPDRLAVLPDETGRVRQTTRRVGGRVLVIERRRRARRGVPGLHILRACDGERRLVVRAVRHELRVGAHRHQESR